MQRLYKINPTCPGCGEEHLYWQVGLTDEEQAILDTHTEEHKGESSIVSLMSPPGLIITRRLKCGCAEQNLKHDVQFTKKMRSATLTLI